MAIWQAHGTAIQRVVDRVIYIKVMGGFNLEGAEDNSNKIMQKVSAHFNDGEAWANFHDLTHFELGTPDLKDVAERHYQWSLKQGMTHEAILAPNMMAREMMQMMLKPFSDSAYFAYFDTMEEALDWLVTQGFLKNESKSVLNTLKRPDCTVIDTQPGARPPY
ncbi:hypothetical protein EYS14_23020 [Alteromonadaceae bacterium M269]|nr:hypothetical protein EYS14_23020 [Alteromonadaceae bacterium M269]